MSDICPVCAIPWPDFCPLDGAKLSGAGSCPNAAGMDEPAATTSRQTTERETEPPPAVVAAKAAADRTGELTQIPGDDEPEAPKRRTFAAKAPEPEPEPEPRKARIVPKSGRPDSRVSDDQLKQTVVEMSALQAPSDLLKDTQKKDAPAAAEPQRRPTIEPKKKKLKPSVLSRIAAAVRGDEDDSRGGATQVDLDRVEAGAQAAADGPKKKKKKKKGFSETQWFLEGVKQDADILEAKSSQETYERDESLSEEERRKYTLSKDEE